MYILPPVAEVYVVRHYEGEHNSSKVDMEEPLKYTQFSMTITNCSQLPENFYELLRNNLEYEYWEFTTEDQITHKVQKRSAEDIKKEFSHLAEIQGLVVEHDNTMVINNKCARYFVFDPKLKKVNLKTEEEYKSKTRSVVNQVNLD